MVRWEEEKRLVEHEMDWTIRWFLNKKTEWQQLANVSTPHLKAYAEKQVSQWQKLANCAMERFKWAKKQPDKRERENVDRNQRMISKYWPG